MRLFDKLFRYEAIDRIFSDREYVQALLDFEAALARAEAKAGVIPAADAQIIAAACRVEQFNVEELAAQAALSGNVAIPLIKKLTELIAKQNKDAARFVHLGATSQDAMDTGLILQLRRALEVLDQDFARLTSTLATLADKHRATSRRRAHLDAASPSDHIRFHRCRLAGRHSPPIARASRNCAPRNLTLQFGGAVGTLAALSSRGPAVAKALAEELRLQMPSIPWHTHRDRITEIATALGLCVGTLGKIARDISLHAQTEIAEIAEPAGEGRGGSSTLPQNATP